MTKSINIYLNPNEPNVSLISAISSVFSLRGPIDIYAYSWAYIQSSQTRNRNYTRNSKIQYGLSTMIKFVPPYPISSKPVRSYVFLFRMTTLEVLSKGYREMSTQEI